jgi:hypothetical protein
MERNGMVKPEQMALSCSEQRGKLRTSLPTINSHYHIHTNNSLFAAGRARLYSLSRDRSEQQKARQQPPNNG